MSTDAIVDTKAGAVATRDYGGSGTPLVYLNGAGMNVGEWDVVAGVVGDGFRQVAMDLPGHGMSYDIDGWRWDEIGDAIDAVVAHHKLDRPVLVGHSLGGIVAITYAAARDRAGAGAPIGVIDVDGWLGPPLPDLDTPAMKDMRKAQLAMMDSLAVPFETILTIQRNAADAQGIRWDAAEPLMNRQFQVDENGIARLRKRSDQIALITSALEYGRIDLRDDLARLPCPLHYVAATSFDMPPGFPVPEGFEEATAAARRELTEWMPSVNPRVTVEALPCGHNIPIMLPDELGAIIARVAAEFAAPRS